MNRRCLAILLAVMVFFQLQVCHAASEPSRPAAGENRQARQFVPLDSDWRFFHGDQQGGESPDLDTSQWQAISLPHTFDAAEGNLGESFYRGPAWYRRDIVLSEVHAEDRTFIEFDGAALRTDVWLNGRSVGRHDGGFARFRFDLTPYLAAGKNLLAVRVDNSKLDTIAPLAGDFAIYGGLYRKVRLITTHVAHFDMMDYGSSGIEIRTPGIDTRKATVETAVRLANDSPKPIAARLIETIYNAGHSAVATQAVPAFLPAGATISVELKMEVPKPHLWDGVRDPYLYTAEFALVGSGEAKLDAQIVPFGIRTVEITKESGLLLNGKHYQVHGVAVHQVMRPATGTAVMDEDAEADFTMLRGMGANGLRFAHYQHHPIEYDLADRMGLLVWTEVPMVGMAGESEAFRGNLEQQMRELIRQNVNHPSVIVWGIGNEVKDTPAVYQALAVNQKTAHEEDATRATTYAACCGTADDPRTRISDLIAYNQYLGWYRGEVGDWSQWLDEFHQQNGHKPMAISEYGAGGSVHQQEESVHRPEARGHRHPEQWQTLVHESAWKQLSEKPWLWASFIWVGFDFPSMGRDEGDHKGRNDKGLITFDRAVKKDAYFWYQANWTTAPMVHITSGRNAVRHDPDAEIKVYSNTPAVTVMLNGSSLGSQNVVNHSVCWHVRLREGQNRIEATTGTLKDSVVWELQSIAKPILSQVRTPTAHIRKASMNTAGSE